MTRSTASVQGVVDVSTASAEDSGCDISERTAVETTNGARRANWLRRLAVVGGFMAVAAVGYGVYASTIDIAGDAGTDEAAGTSTSLTTNIGCQTSPVSVSPVYREDFATTSGFAITLTGFRLSGLTETCLTGGITAMLAYNTGDTWQELPTPITLSEATDGTLIAPAALSAPASMAITGYSLRLSGGQAPTAPTVTSATNGNTSTTVTWTPPVNPGNTAITGFQYTLNGGNTWTPLPSNSSPVTIAGLTNNTTYVLALRAVNATGPGPASNTTEITPQAAPENTPADIVIAGGNTGL